jgi:long-chain alkane monooxygenase
MGITVVVGRTQREAQEKFDEYARHASPEAGLAHFAAGSGIDYSKELDLRPWREPF